MTISANQPYFVPYLPYWQLIDCADLFLVSDDFAFMKHSWITRNFILVGGNPQYFRLEVKKASCHKLIKDTEIMPPNLRNKLRTLEMAYHRSPCFNAGYELIERVLRYPQTNLCDFLTASIREICAYLGITTRLDFTSSVPGNAGLRREERIYHFCNYFGADRYVNAIGGQDMYHFSDFRARGLELNFLRSEAGLPRLSVIDAIMNYSREQLRDLLDKRSFIHE